MRISESQLRSLVKRFISEQAEQEPPDALSHVSDPTFLQRYPQWAEAWKHRPGRLGYMTGNGRNAIIALQKEFENSGHRAKPTKAFVEAYHYAMYNADARKFPPEINAYYEKAPPEKSEVYRSSKTKAEPQFPQIATPVGSKHGWDEAFADVKKMAEEGMMEINDYKRIVKSMMHLKNVTDKRMDAKKPCTERIAEMIGKYSDVFGEMSLPTEVLQWSDTAYED